MITLLKLLYRKILFVSSFAIPYRFLNPYKQFIRAGGDDLLVNGFDLSTESTVIDFGGYLGDWSNTINCMYEPHLYIVEPVNHFCNHLQTRFQSFTNVQVFPFAIGTHSFKSDIAIAGDATSFFGLGERVPVIFEPFDLLHSAISSETIDLACINIEGGEYDLLEILISEGHILRFRTLLIQFHDLGVQSINLRADLEFRLSQSHLLKFDFPMVWQRWDRK